MKSTAASARGAVAASWDRIARHRSSRVPATRSGAGGPMPRCSFGVTSLRPELRVRWRFHLRVQRVSDSLMPSVRVVRRTPTGTISVRPADEAGSDVPALARAMCHRHHGIGADGLIVYSLRDRGATMKLLNADGSWSELSGNGLRCLAALVARNQDLRPDATLTVDTDAGVKRLELLARDGERYTFRAAMGQPTNLRRPRSMSLASLSRASVLEVGNPQCIVLGPLPDAERFNRLGPALATHAMFPAGTNVEFVHVEAPDRVRIVIWERGVGPTTSSGTGSSASAVAAAAHGGAARAVDVVAPAAPNASSGVTRAYTLPAGRKSFSRGSGREGSEPALRTLNLEPGTAVQVFCTVPTFVVAETATMAPARLWSRRTGSAA